MSHFLEEQETTSKPPEPRGEKTPDDDEDEDEPVRWDGSEAELVADDTAQLFDEQHSGIKLQYSLTSKEVFMALIKSQYTETRIALSAVGIILSAALMIYFLVQYNVTRSQSLASLAFVCAVLILFIGVWPSLNMRIHSKKYADGKEVKMKIYPDHIEMGHVESKWEIPLDGTTERAVFQNLMILYIGSKNMVILPLRCVEPAVLPEVQAMILAGTQPI
jgi:hypothetical protein